MTRHREVYYVDHEGDFGLTGLAGALSSVTGPRLDAPTVLALAARTARTTRTTSWAGTYGSCWSHRCRTS
ncbi:hypothetical protein QNO09_24825 [Streptomyces sp. 378]|uniref:hypothetical protein n=1 Tax=Streptomyces sp. 378 TaxID=3049412 RepID=UPI0024C36403|nr:hypothetical protein [Streptomyces sp. 378]MDK1346470.1 hypothetical protein [Streptomyces sp. 378]